MYKLVLIILFALGISGTTEAHGERNALAKIQLGKHMKFLNAFPCKKPQLRVIPVQDLIQNQSPDQRFYPPVTVLARCDTYAGCCPREQICGPKDTKEVDLYFVVNYVSGETRDKHQELIKARNHTECECTPSTV